ncbi:phosphoacetylglucosamine mutase, putative [Plasmodium knowlesi strain H]|uniref:Phosphoacetylglucosamine mutase, putative n=3 Tax=Plasmodium knowlesi TaxID=5850 RepID=A0A5K1UR32_PLAKH|nr:phosphoacetylglucosamine mutase, putative [Plasmodium knowlesi strain H]OTN65120.1 putative N-acetyl glucosamine phosphate mutase [Plasmodium knowlesi]CAA9988326.1 phosphoacetylglucosamine mutase, putative [Plasmodium knowlesi strain H]SBO20170.1 phosphoacetylglucosamine mutase, putative [Plasmodium knowlesi strain H]SBO20276.1 phosphoacetylglucosamine mutase, putative [Plasmodium knowlesi strain H]VVS77800.1 phosphoacetylglucosamine mutase, putative [Plasmodium knowlesi strain H]|eukprot:XP_002259305.1 n-acetyl glucosamine phosphate mutase, putative [Plasmodium knowlesi strain H]
MPNRKESLFYQKIKPCIEKYLPRYSPSEEGHIQFECNCEFSYGNSGFRDKYQSASCDLLNALNKSGIFVGLLFIKYNYETAKRHNLFGGQLEGREKDLYHMCSVQKVRWKNVGIIITASHNPHDENGVKIIDKNGRQINESYESYLTDLVNRHLRFLRKNEKCSINDIVDNIIDCIVHLFKEEAHIDLYDDFAFESLRMLDNMINYFNRHNAIKANVCIGFDTRSSSIHLNQILVETLSLLNICKCVNNMFYVTTPCMHFVVYFFNAVNVDEALDPDVINSGGNSLHKELGDLDYLRHFCLPGGNALPQELYYGRSENSYDQLSHPEGEVRTVQSSNVTHLMGYNSDRIYFDYFTHAFKKLYRCLDEIFKGVLTKNCEEEIIHVDCSNGVASLKLDNFCDVFKMLKKKIIKINFAEDEESVLNFHCGADYVYSKRKLPLDRRNCLGGGHTKSCSFDGDVDRIVYFYVDNTGRKCTPEEWDTTLSPPMGDTKLDHHQDDKILRCTKCVSILDGPKIICLFFKCITKIMSPIQVGKKSGDVEEGKKKKINITIVHTAYVNSAFIHHMNEEKRHANKNMDLFQYINVNIVCTKTGIKYLDQVARKSTIAILFEPNGHGTIYTNISQLNEWATWLEIQNDKYFLALKKFLLFFNQTTGDAMVDFIAIELCLSFLHLSIHDWDDFYTPFPSLYINLPCSKYMLCKIIAHPEHEKYLIAPQSLQSQIDKIVQTVDTAHGRCFIRSSGTEPLIRIYAEARTVAQRDEILRLVRGAVLQYMQGCVEK